MTSEGFGSIKWYFSREKFLSEEAILELSISYLCFPIFLYITYSRSHSFLLLVTVFRIIPSAYGWNPNYSKMINWIIAVLLLNLTTASFVVQLVLSENTPEHYQTKLDSALRKELESIGNMVPITVLPPLTLTTELGTLPAIKNEVRLIADASFSSRLETIIDAYCSQT
jgi:hypothetical protein